MPTLNINGQRVNVGDEFMSLPPEQQNATVDEIAKSLGPSQAAPMAPEQKPSMAMDAIKSGGIGVAKGAIGLAGLYGDLGNMVTSASDYIASKLMSPEKFQRGKEIIEASKSGLRQPSSGDIQGKIEGVTGEFYKPQTMAGEYAQTAGQFLPGMALGRGSLIQRAVTNVAVPAIASETAGQVTKGTAFEPWARAAGALASPALIAGAKRLVTPIPADPARQRLVDVLQGEGVTSLTAGQRTGSKPLQYAESVLGDSLGSGSPVQRIQQEGRDQFTQAAMRRAGGGPDASPDSLAANSNRLGQEFRSLSARNNLQFDPQFGQDIVGAIKGYQKVPPSQQRAIVEGYVDDISQHIAKGAMPGPDYQEMRSRLSRQANSLRNSDPTLSDTLRNMRNSLDDAMSRSISPADREAWKTARQQYGAQKIIEKAASRAGEATAEGQLVPANLRNTVAAENRGSYAKGQGDFSELSRAGSAIMAPLPQSGTAPRVTMQMLASMIGGGLGTAGGPAGTGLGAAAGAIAGPAALGRVLMSRPVQGYLGNQVLQPGPRDNLRDAIVRALLAEQAQPSRITSEQGR